jgi:serine-type D-Ala-D-Ala carboxypeptidase (penicillin-binding protein 5/6)
LNPGITRRRLGATLLGSASFAVAAPVLAAPSAQAATTMATPTVSASGAFLYDKTGGRKLWGKNGTTRRQMASTTKVMTALVVLSRSNLNLDRLITIKQAYRDYVTAQGASTADLREGDRLTVRQLLYAMMLPSGCDAAMALADNFGSGTTIRARTTSFIGKMNRKAQDLGLADTHYDSFDGISRNGENYTTARDAAILASRALNYETLRTVVSTQKAVKTATNGRTYTWYNTNQLLGSYNGAFGIKTGTGTAAGPCLIFAARRNGRTIVGVVLNSSSADQRYDDAAEMLNYGFGTSSAGTMTLRSLPEGAQRD